MEPPRGLELPGGLPRNLMGPFKSEAELFSVLQNDLPSLCTFFERASDDNSWLIEHIPILEGVVKQICLSKQPINLDIARRIWNCAKLTIGKSFITQSLLEDCKAIVEPTIIFTRTFQLPAYLTQSLNVGDIPQQVGYESLFVIHRYLEDGDYKSYDELFPKKIWDRFIELLVFARASGREDLSNAILGKIEFSYENLSEFLERARSNSLPKLQGKCIQWVDERFPGLLRIDGVQCTIKLTRRYENDFFFLRPLLHYLSQKNYEMKLILGPQFLSFLSHDMFEFLTASFCSSINFLEGVEFTELISNELILNFFVIARSCSNIQELNMGKCSAVRNDHLKLLGNNTKLRSLTLHQAQISDEGLEILAKFKGLTYLDLSDCGGISDQGLENIANGCRELSVLFLSSCLGVNGKGLQLIFENCLKLTHVVLKSIYQLSERSLMMLSKAENLQTLIVENCNQISGETILRIVEKCSKLSHLEIILSRFYNQDFLKIVEKCRNLKVLQISFNSSMEIPENSVVALIANCAQLTTLGLINYQNLGFDAIHALSTLKNLHHLNLSRTPTPTKSVIELSKSCKGLTHLNIRESKDLTDEALLMLGEFAKNLSSLTLSSCVGLTTDGFRALAMGCTKLRAIHINGSSLSFNSLVVLLQKHQAFPDKNAQITELNLHHSNLTEDEFLELIDRNIMPPSLTLNHCDGLTNKVLVRLVKESWPMALLDVRFCGNFDLTGIAKARAICPNLTDFFYDSDLPLGNLDNLKSEEILAFFKELDDPTKAEIAQRVVPKLAEKAVINASTIRSLYYYAYAFSSDTLQKRCHEWSSKTFEGTLRVSTRGYFVLTLKKSNANLALVESILRMIFTSFPQPLIVEIKAEGLKEMKELENVFKTFAMHIEEVHCLDFNNTYIEDLEFTLPLLIRNISTLGKLRSLYLKELPFFKMDYLSPLKQCRELTTLDLCQSKIVSDKNAWHLKDLIPSLDALYLSKTELTDTIIEGLGVIFPLLKILDISCSYKISGKTIAAMGKHCKNLVTLNLAHCDIDSKPRRDETAPEVTSISEMTEFLLKLQDLNLSHCYMNPKGWRQLPLYLKNIKFLSLAHCTQVDDIILSDISLRCSPLTGLNLEGCYHITDRGMQEIAQKCTELLEINLSSCEKISDQTLLHLGDHAKKLVKFTMVASSHEVDIANRKLFSSVGLVHLAKNCPFLTTINLTGHSELSNYDIKEFFLHAASNQRLKEINLTGIPLITYHGILYGLKILPKMKMIHLIGCPNIRPEFFPKGLTKVLSYNLPDFKNESLFGWVFKGRLALRPDTKEKREKDDDVELDKYFSRYGNITSLNLTHCRLLTDAALKKIFQKCKTLQELDLSFCEQFTTEGIVQALTEDQPLERLDLTGCSIQDKALEAIGMRCTKLHTLILYQCERLTLAGIERLIQLRKDTLRCIYINMEVDFRNYPNLKVFSMQE